MLKETVRKTAENEARKLHQVSLLMPLNSDDIRRLEVLARVIRLIDGGDMPTDDDARFASIEQLVDGLRSDAK
jgi:hypothetical protein